MRKGDRVVLERDLRRSRRGRVPRRGSVRDRPPPEPSPVVRHGHPPLPGLASGAHRVHRDPRRDLHAHARLRDRPRATSSSTRTGRSSAAGVGCRRCSRPVRAREAACSRASRFLGSGARRARARRRHRRGRARRGPRARSCRAPTGSSTRCGRAACRRATPVATLTRNSRRAAPDAAGGLPGGLAVRADQHAPHRRRGRRTSSPTPAPRRSIADERVRATVAGAAADSAGMPPVARLAVGRHARLRPDGRRARRAARHALPTTASRAGSCSTRRAPPDDRRRCSARRRRCDPETQVAALRRQPHPLRHRARRRRRPPRDVADVPHVAVVVRLLLVALRAHRRADGAMGRRARAPAHRALPRHRRRDGAHAAPPADAAARGRARALRRVVAAPGDPRRGAVPHRPQAAAVRLARPGDLRVLRRDGGRRHAGEAARLARAPGHRRQAVARRRRQDPRRRRERAAAATPWARCT